MNLEAAKLAAANNVWAAIWPELALGGIALLLLVLEILLPKRRHAIIGDVATAGFAWELQGSGQDDHPPAPQVIVFL